MIKCACHAVDRARGDLNVVGKYEWAAVSSIPKNLGSLFKGVLTPCAVSDLDRPTK
jgi:hypothetical protein